MKKLAMSAIAAAAVMGAGAAHAYTVGTFGNGFVVPNVITEASGATTAVGIINASGASVPVFWTFFDQDSGHVTDGCFEMTDRDFHPFVWSNESGVGLTGMRGYLLFVGGNTGDTCRVAPGNAPGTGVQLSANAFQVDPAARDVAFTPVLDGDVTLSGANSLSTLGAYDLLNVAGAADVPANAATAGGAPTMFMRYYVDGAAGGTDTRIVVWSTGNHSGTHTVNMFDDKQDRKSVNFTLTRSELDWFDPETILGRPATHVDGFIEWNVGQLPTNPGGVEPVLADRAYVGSVFTYSLIDAPAFGAKQTLLGSHR